jgi:multiple sugar transport system substrate-binding protein
MWRWRNRYYGLPFIGIRIGYFNRALAQQVGARVPATWKDPAWTFEAFREAAQKATGRSEAGATRWGADMAAASVRRDWQPWVWNNGGDLFDAEGTRIEFDQPPAVEALEFLVDLVHRHRVAPSPQQLSDAGGRAGIFRTGNLLAYHAPVNNIAQNRQGASFDWSLFGLPRGKGKTVWASGGGVGWFTPAGSRVKDETWELMKFLASKESVRIEALRGEVPPSRRSVAADPAYVNPPEAPRGDMMVVREALEVMHLEPPLLNGIDVDRILTEELTPVWRGERPVREALAGAAAKVKPLLNPAS